jgi:hypothetical protein
MSRKGYWPEKKKIQTQDITTYRSPALSSLVSLLAGILAKAFALLASCILRKTPRL